MKSGVELIGTGGGNERFYLSIVHAPLVRIEMSKKVWVQYREALIDVFGAPFIEAEYKQQDGLVCYDFEIDMAHIDVIRAALKHLMDSRTVTNIDIDINLN